MRIQREQVVRAALALLDEVGVEGLTMRRLAQALDIQAPSLYWHFASKQVLLDAMADALIADVAREPPASSSWADVVTTTASELRRAFARHRDGARVYAGTYVVSENTLRVSEALIGALSRAGLSPRVASWGSFSVLDYVLGFSIEEQAFLHPGAEGLDLGEREKRLKALSLSGFPYVASAADDILDRDLDRRFAFGLELLVAGLRSQVGASPPPPKPKARRSR